MSDLHLTSHVSPLTAAALTGPTGSGKSALAMALAKKAGTSILCCDSMQVYRGLDIGTAKPSREDRKAVAHAMVDCCTLPDTFSAARWAEGASAWIRRENAAGRIPLIVGGTGLYLRALVQGLADIPPERQDVRRRLQQRLEDEGIAALHAELARVDAVTAARLHATDTQRILRALGIHESTGRPLSAWLKDDRKLTAPAIRCPVFVLGTPRDVLRGKLEKRFHAMLDAGWLDEVRRLDSLQLPDCHPAMRAVGYRQLLMHLQGICPLAEAIRTGVIATWRYAKRQRTWFAHQAPNATWGDAGQLGPHVIEALQS